MSARAAQKQPRDRGTVAAPAGDGTHEQNLVESELSVVEVLFGCLQLQLIRPSFEDLRDALRQPLMGSRWHVLDVELQAVSIEALHLDVRGRRVSAVLGVVVGPLQVVEGWRDAEIRVARGGARSRVSVPRATTPRSLMLRTARTNSGSSSIATESRVPRGGALDTTSGARIVSPLCSSTTPIARPFFASTVARLPRRTSTRFIPSKACVTFDRTGRNTPAGLPTW